MEKQRSQTTVGKDVTGGDTPAALASAAPSAGAATPPASQDAPVDDHKKQPQLQAFWSSQLAKIEQATEIKTQSLPLARIKKIVKDAADVPRITGEVPAVFAKACEMFIKELTLRAWLRTEEDKRRTLQKKDVTMALAGTEVLDFLVDDSPSDKPKAGGGLGLPVASTATATQDQDDDDPYANYYWDDYSPPWSPDDGEPSGLGLPPNVTCDDTRYYTYIHDYYSL